jgi:glycosyltransferase involved in cell wall biosynthesis
MTERWATSQRGDAAPGRVLVVNLDFRDVIYSHFWARAVVEGSTRRGFVTDVVTVTPFAGRDLAVELGVSRPELELPTEGVVTYVDTPDEHRHRSCIAELLGRHRYKMLFLNCDAPLFVHLLLERERELAGAVWVVYDRHLHLDLPGYEQEARVRDRILASNLHLYTIHEIASAGVTFGVEREIVANQQTTVSMFNRFGLSGRRLHFQQWPLDDRFFAPREAPADGFVVFSGGDSGRDYATLFEAVRGLPVQVRLCSAGYPTPRPPNVTVLPRLPLHRFRDEVGAATAVVVPLTGEPVVSGITVIAIAKMMGKAVIASDNPIMRLHIPSQGDGGYLTQTGNPALLRTLLNGLLESPAERARLARDAREQASRQLSLTGFVDRMFALQ